MNQSEHSGCFWYHHSEAGHAFNSYNRAVPYRPDRYVGIKMGDSPLVLNTTFLQDGHFFWTKLRQIFDHMDDPWAGGRMTTQRLWNEIVRGVGFYESQYGGLVDEMARMVFELIRIGTVPSGIARPDVKKDWAEKIICGNLLFGTADDWSHQQKLLGLPAVRDLIQGLCINRSMLMMGPSREEKSEFLYDYGRMTTFRE